MDIHYTGKIKKVYDSKYFHGRLTDEEAMNLCQEELTKTGKPYVYIWFLSELESGRLQGTYRRYQRDFKLIHFAQHFDYWTRMCQNNWEGFRRMEYLVERKNPITLLELARVATLDNCNGYCCLRSLIEKIDQLRLPTREKEELKKLAHGFRETLLENLPNELCIH